MNKYEGKAKALLELLETEILDLKRIRRMFNAQTKEDKKELELFLKDLEVKGLVYLHDSKVEKLPDGYITDKLFIVGKTKLERKKYKVTDNHIVKPHKLNGALEGDIVILDTHTSEIVKVVKRGNSKLSCEVRVTPTGGKELIPKYIENPEFIKVRIDNNNMKKLLGGDIIEVEIGTETNEDGVYECEFITKIGNKEDPKTEYKAMLVSHNVIINYTDDALTEAENIPTKVTNKELKGRKSQTHLHTFTIDNDGSKDKDDALTLVRLENGHYKVIVHIASVADYVKSGTALDTQIDMRPSSVYLRNYVLHMLPENLAKGICSLTENKVRLALAVEMEFDENLEKLEEKSKIYPAVIKSKKAMCYSEANRVFDNDNPKNDYLPFKDDLEILLKIADKESEKAKKLDITSDEIEYEFAEDGETLKNVKKLDHGKSGHLIEEMMIMANETVAKYCTRNNISIPYRVHETPSIEKVIQIEEEIRELGVNLRLPSTDDPSVRLKAILEETKGLQAYPYICNSIILRYIPRAYYTVNNIGHYGVNKAFYTHFTSPIRRGTDTRLHQALLHHLRNELIENKLEKEELEKFCKTASNLEKKLDEVEREVDKQEAINFAKDHLGASYECFVHGFETIDFKPYIHVITDNKIEGYIPLYAVDKNLKLGFKKSRVIDKNNNTIIRRGDRLLVESILYEERFNKIIFGLQSNLVSEYFPSHSPKVQLSIYEEQRLKEYEIINNKKEKHPRQVMYDNELYGKEDTDIKKKVYQKKDQTETKRRAAGYIN